VTAVYVVLVGMGMLVVGAFVATTLFVYLGRALARVRSTSAVRIPTARVVNRQRAT
jgi:hypothetical protein